MPEEYLNLDGASLSTDDLLQLGLARYKIRVRSPELSEIRQELTGLRTGPNNGHFVILVGVRNPELNEHEEFEKKLSPDEKHGELDDKEDDMDEY